MLHEGFRVQGVNNTSSQFFDYHKNDNKITINYIKNNLKLTCVWHADANELFVKNQYFKGQRFRMNASEFVDKKGDFKCLRTLFSDLQQQLQGIDSSNPTVQPLLPDDEEKPLELVPIRAPESAEDGSRKPDPNR